jgi:WD40 repeat protein
MEIAPAGPRAAPPKPRWSSAPASGAPLDVAARWQPIWSRPGERVEVRWKRELREVEEEVEKPGEVLAPRWVPSLAVAAAGVAAGLAILRYSSSPALGLAAAGGGLLATRAIPARRRAIRVRAKEKRREEQQVKEEAKVTAPGHRSAVMGLQCSADARRLLAVTRLGECGVWDVPADRFEGSGLRLPPFEQAAVAEGARRVVLATERAALVFDLAGAKRTEHAGDPARRLRAVALTRDGARMALGFDPPLVRVIEVASRKVVGELPLQGARISALSFSEDGQALAVGTGGGAFLALRLGTRIEKVAEERAHKGAVTAVAVAGKGQLFASADEGGLVAVWSKDGKRRAAATLPGRGVQSLCFAGTGPYALLAGCGDGSVRAVDPDSGAPGATHAIGGGAVTALSWARDKMAAAAGTASGKVVLLAADE